MAFFETASFMKAFENKMTQTGAKVAINVALAIVVLKIDRCQKNKSPAKNSPQQMMGQSNVQLIVILCLRASILAQNHNIGSPKNTRQNALANGPTSAKRTNTGETPMAIAPMINSANDIGNDKLVCEG